MVTLVAAMSYYVWGINQIDASYPSGKGIIFLGRCKNMNMFAHEAVSPNLQAPFMTVFIEGL